MKKTKKKTAPASLDVHAIKNQLTTIILSAELLSKEEYPKAGAQQKEYLRTIISCSRKITDLLDSSKSKQ